MAVRKTHFVRVRLDYVICFGRELDSIPHELNPFHPKKGKGVRDLILDGLKSQFRKSKEDAILMPHGHVHVSLFFPRSATVKKAAAPLAKAKVRKKNR